MTSLTIDTITAVAREGTTVPAGARLRGAYPPVATVVDFPFIPEQGRGAPE